MPSRWYVNVTWGCHVVETWHQGAQNGTEYETDSIGAGDMPMDVGVGSYSAESGKEEQTETKHINQMFLI